jgi:hypothetical protein
MAILGLRRRNGTDVAKVGNAHNLEGELSGRQFFLFFPR